MLDRQQTRVGPLALTCNDHSRCVIAEASSLTYGCMPARASAPMVTHILHFVLQFLCNNCTRHSFYMLQTALTIAVIATAWQLEYMYVHAYIAWLRPVAAPYLAPYVNQPYMCGCTTLATQCVTLAHPSMVVPPHTCFVFPWSPL